MCSVSSIFIQCQRHGCHSIPFAVANPTMSIPSRVSFSDCAIHLLTYQYSWLFAHVRCINMHLFMSRPALDKTTKSDWWVLEPRKFLFYLPAVVVSIIRWRGQAWKAKRKALLRDLCYSGPTFGHYWSACVLAAFPCLFCHCLMKLCCCYSPSAWTRQLCPMFFIILPMPHFKLYIISTSHL